MLASPLCAIPLFCDFLWLRVVVGLGCGVISIVTRMFALLLRLFVGLGGR